MYKRKKIAEILAVLICIVCVFSGCGKAQTQESAESAGVQSEAAAAEKVSINSLGMTASGGNVEKVNWECDRTETDSQIYKIETIDYSEEEIEEIFKCLDGEAASIEKNMESDGITTYVSDEGSRIECIKDTGYIQYSSKDLLEGAGSQPVKKKKGDSYYLDKAMEVVEQIGLEDTINAELGKVKMSEYMEYVDGDGNTKKEPVKYRVDYLQDNIDDVEIDGSCPGVFVEFDASGEVCSFTNVGRKIEEKTTVIDSQLKDEKEIEKSILNMQDVSISEFYDENAEITITSCDMIYYSDPANLKQENMIPYYKLKAAVKGSGEKIDLLLPALKDDMIEYIMN